MNNEARLFKMHKMEARTLTWWRARRDRIDVDPTYQRKGRRWSISDKQYFVDSILNGFDIPKFYIADFTWGDSALNEKKLEYAVIDGKQRFEAIFDFFDDKFTLAGDFKFMRKSSLELSGLKYSELKVDFPDIAEIFDNFNLDVVSVITSGKEFVEELFVRLNRSKPLSGAEIRNAIAGEFSTIVRNIRDHEFFTSNVRFNTARGQDLNCAAKIFIFEITGEFQETKKSNLDRFVRDNNYSQEHVEASVGRIFWTLEQMSEIFQFRDVLLQSEGPIPVYYWLFRNTEQKNLPYIRDFLAFFKRELASDRGSFLHLGEQEAYRLASRSVNDKFSHYARYSILLEVFHRWLVSEIAPYVVDS
jgi:hypothetical protein